MSEATRSCPVCGSGNAAAAERCWVCGASMRAEVRASLTAPPVDATERGWKALAWLALLFGIFFVCALVGVELALQWPGLLVPFAFFCVVIFVALGRIAWVQMREGKADEKERSAGEEVARSVALGITIAAGVIGLIFLLIVSALIFFALVCFAVLSVGSIH